MAGLPLGTRPAATRDEAMSDATPDLDLSTLTYDEWIALFFDRRELEEGEFFDEAFLDDAWITSPADPGVVIAHMTRTWTEFPALAERFSHKQLDQGIWAMLGPTCMQADVLLKPGAPLKTSIDCIHAMEIVFRDYVAKLEIPVMENGFYMWWDFVCETFWSQRRHLIPEMVEREAPPKKGARPAKKRGAKRGPTSIIEGMTADDRALLDAVFGVLTRILALPNVRTQGCALHGLGHLHHPGVRDVVQRYIAHLRRKRVDANWVWLEQCADGTVM